MALYDLEQVRSILKIRISPERYLHSLGVAGLMGDLGEVFDFDPGAGYFVGLWHDMAREWSADELVRFVEHHNLRTLPFERKRPVLLHGAVAAQKMELYYEDATESMWNALRWHTTGHPDLDILGKALYVADYVEPTRKHMSAQEKRFILEAGSIDYMVLRVYDHIIRGRGRKERDLSPLTKRMVENIHRTVRRYE